MVLSIVTNFITDGISSLRTQRLMTGRRGSSVYAIIHCSVTLVARISVHCASEFGSLRRPRGLTVPRLGNYDCSKCP